MPKTKTDSPRKRYYVAHIERHLEVARLGPRQRERAMEPGWSKVRLYAHLLDRENYDEWTEFALANPVEVVAQQPSAVVRVFLSRTACGRSCSAYPSP